MFQNQFHTKKNLITRYYRFVPLVLLLFCIVCGTNNQRSSLLAKQSNANHRKQQYKIDAKLIAADLLKSDKVKIFSFFGKPVTLETKDKRAKKIVSSIAELLRSGKGITDEAPCMCMADYELWFHVPGVGNYHARLVTRHNTLNVSTDSQKNSKQQNKNSELFTFVKNCPKSFVKSMATTLDDIIPKKK